MHSTLEHANLSVRDIDGMVDFLTTALPDFSIRHDHTDADGRRWVHVGNAHSYVALNQAREDRTFTPYAGQRGCNHLGWVVDDVQTTRKRLTRAGYVESTYPNAHPHRTRVYFNDAEGNDWEFVEYHSDEPALRNDYALADS